MDRSPNESSESGRFLPSLLLLFVGSGCAALIYEVVWFELLRQVIGASSVSLAILLASFMGGMCLGSLAFPRWVPAKLHPLRVYAVLELGIGVAGIAMLLLLPLVRLLYVAVFGYGLAGILLRAAVCLLCLLPPTMLMGATLPAVARWMETTRIGVSRLGFLYMANIGGAVAGCLLAGFYLLRDYDMVVATAVAVAINATVALVSMGLARRGRFTAVEAAAPPGPSGTDTSVRPAERADADDEDARRRPSPDLGIASPGRRLVYLVIALSGFTALGAEVVWTRLLSLLMGATVYTFSIILAVFLLGLGIGSSAGSFMARHVARPAASLGWSQLLLVGAIPLGAYMINSEIPFWYVNPEFLPDLPQRYLHDLLRGIVAMLPATCLWGASFPLALAASARDRDEPGRLVGDVYAANTVGAIAGSLAFGMVMIPWAGTQRSQQWLVLMAGAAALLVFGTGLATSARGALRTAASRGARGRRGRTAADGPTATDSDVGTEATGGRMPAPAVGIVATVIMVAFIAAMSWATPPTAGGLIAYGRLVDEWSYIARFHFVGEGRSTSVAVTDYSEGGVRSFHVGGKVVASNKPIDMRIERMLGHVPALAHPAPKSVLVVGFGAGVTAGAFVTYPGVERIVICEIEPLVPVAAGRHFAVENYDVLNDPRTEVIYDDARHFIATTREKFDVITSDPIHPWVRGAASLYTREYFELVKQRLNPGGVVAQWVPLYETGVDAVKTEMATFFEAFPEGTAWNSDNTGEGYDVVMLGKVGPLSIDVLELDARLRDNPSVESSLAEVDLGSAITFLSSYLVQASDLEGWLADAEVNRDRSLRLQYLAGGSVDRWETGEIFRQIARHRRYPENIFVAPSAIEQELRRYF